MAKTDGLLFNPESFQSTWNKGSKSCHGLHDLTQLLLPHSHLAYLSIHSGLFLLQLHQLHIYFLTLEYMSLRSCMTNAVKVIQHSAQMCHLVSEDVPDLSMYNIPSLHTEEFPCLSSIAIPSSRMRPCESGCHVLCPGVPRM
jgi:hypothetical protein